MFTANNPILSGFYPDPSICAVGEDFYLVLSSFSYFPGVPIFHSRDLAHWEPIGHVLDRKSQLPLEGCEHSEGIFAPTIRYHKGIFYMITTNVSGGGNFVVVSEDPKGEWSEPYYIDDAPGIDPSLFFDDDDRCYYIGTRPNPEGPRYNGDWEVWVQELDLQTMKLTGESCKIWKGAMKDVIWPEGPHLYKKDGFYYLMIAEGGTGPSHCITVARSTTITGKYEGNPDNPIITHRHLGKDYPVIHVGHGDLVENSSGDWFIVMLASRPCEGYTNLGRETFLAKVEWENGWPVINPGIGKLEDQIVMKGEPSCVVPKDHCYHFYEKTLDHSFMMLRNPKENTYSFHDREGFLRLSLLPSSLSELTSPAYIGVRQKHYNYQMNTYMDFQPVGEGEEAGIAVVQSNRYYIRFVKSIEQDQGVIRLILCEDGKESLLAQHSINGNAATLKIVNRSQKADFYCCIDGVNLLIAEQVAMYKLSTEIAGGFTGCTIGMYASSNGHKSNNYADYGWFSYSPLLGND